MDYQFGRGTCATCGFLGNRKIPPSPSGETYHEVSKAQRTTGDVIRYVAQPPNSYNVELQCFVGAADLESEIRHLHSDGEEPNQEMFRQVFNHERDCPAWWAYQPSFDPKWHLEQRQMQYLQESQNQTQRTISHWTAAQAIVSVLAIVVTVLLVLLFQGGGSTVNNYGVTLTPQSTSSMAASPPQPAS